MGGRNGVWGRQLEVSKLVFIKKVCVTAYYCLFVLLISSVKKASVIC